MSKWPHLLHEIDFVDSLMQSTVVFATNLEHIKRIGTINALLGSQIDMEKKTFLHSTANYFAGKVS